MTIGIGGSPAESVIMTVTPESMPGSFGGQWTVEKLDILRSYLDAYNYRIKKQAIEADVRRRLCRHG